MKNILQYACAAILSLASFGPAFAQEAPLSRLLQADAGHHGQLEALLVFERDGSGWIYQGEHFTIGLDENGALRTLGDPSELSWEFVADETGDIAVEHALFGGQWRLLPADAGWSRDYSGMDDALAGYMQQWLYDPRLLEAPAYQAFRSRFSEGLGDVGNDFELIALFDEAWDDSLFSHFEIIRPNNSLEGMLEDADADAEGRPVARFEQIDDEIALVTIDSFFGLDIEAQIAETMDAAIQSGANSLIIDLRENAGGTSSAIPVLSRILQEEGVFGYFIANSWWQSNASLPTTAQLAERSVMNGRSNQELFGELLSTGMVSARLTPSETTFDGDVYVLISGRSGSATEALVGMMAMSGRVVLIGETTAGNMLSSNLFPLADGFSVRIPVADFYLSDGSRIDGNGVAPDVRVESEFALDEAVRRIRAHN